MKWRASKLPSGRPSRHKSVPLVVDCCLVESMTGATNLNSLLLLVLMSRLAIRAHRGFELSPSRRTQSRRVLIKAVSAAGCCRRLG
jgi:hypothetical protein